MCLSKFISVKLALEHNSIKASMGGENSKCDFTDKVHIKEHRLQHLISIMTSEIYQEQRKLPPA